MFPKELPERFKWWLLVPILIFLLYAAWYFGVYYRPYSDFGSQRKSESDYWGAVDLINTCAELNTKLEMGDEYLEHKRWRQIATLSTIEKIETKKNSLALVTCILLLLVTLMMIIKIMYSYCYSDLPFETLTM